VIAAKVIADTNHPHPRPEQSLGVSNRTATADQTGQRATKGRIQPLNVSCIDHISTAAGDQHLGNRTFASLHDLALNASNTPLQILLDYLPDQQARFAFQSRSSRLAGQHAVTKALPEGADVACQPIHADQYRQRSSAATHVCHQCRDQVPIALSANHTAQPQARRDCHRHRLPGTTTDQLDPQPIGLDVLEVNLTLLDQVLVELLSMVTSSLKPGSHGTFIQAEGCHDRLDWTAMCQQGQDDHQQIGRLSQAIEWRAAAGSECPTTCLTAIALLLLAMDCYVALPELASCGTVQVMRGALNISEKSRGCAEHNQCSELAVALLGLGRPPNWLY